MSTPETSRRGTPKHASAPGTSKQSALRAHWMFRLVLFAVLAVLAVLLGQNVVEVASDQVLLDSEMSGLAVGVVATLAAALAFAYATSTRVWVEASYDLGSDGHSPATLNMTRFGHHAKGLLRSPHTLRFTGTNPWGPRPHWDLTLVHDDAKPGVSVGSPWTTDLGRLVDLLRPIVAGDPQLAGDDTTRDLLLGAQPNRRR